MQWKSLSTASPYIKCKHTDVYTFMGLVFSHITSVINCDMSEQDCQTANTKTTTASMQFGPLMVHYVGVYDLWSGACTQTCRYFFTSAHGQTTGKLKPWVNNKDRKYPCL